MSDFGHIARIGNGVCLDSWGTGPFVIEADGKRYRFEDSDQFGPSLIKLNGDPLTNPWPSSRSQFWRAHRIWARQGRRVKEDGVTCVWDEPKPQIVRRINSRNVILVEPGEPDGKTVFASPE